MCVWVLDISRLGTSETQSPLHWPLFPPLPPITCMEPLSSWFHWSGTPVPPPPLPLSL